ncbi:MAG: hypothetical protein KIT84_22165 [Labilithrix sp.]|nr:hypothetical protein [Labilithrix sp.]MCW5813751.1 hypothetical protein [Labilithrix sp.]
MAVGATGCATGIEDPQPAPAPVTQSRGAPQTPFSADISDEAPPDPAQITPGLDAPELDREFNPPVPSGKDAIDPHLQVEDEVPVNG